MISKVDKIYYNYRFLNKNPKKWYWKLYCIIRKSITISESPSRVMIWLWEIEYENIK
jgi:hypothetical protein